MISPFKKHQAQIRAALAGEELADDDGEAVEPEAPEAPSDTVNGASAPISPFRLHRQTVSAQLAASTGLNTGIAPAIDEANPGASEYRALLASLHEDLRQISDIHSHDARKPVKLAKAETYRPWVEGALKAGEQGAATQDEIVAEMLVWAIDTGDYAWALEIAAHMLAHGVAMPERFPSTSVAAFVASKVAEAALVAGSSVPLATLQHVSSLTHGHDMHDEKRATLMKALARAYAKAADDHDPASDNAAAGGKAALTNAALIHAKRALELNKNAGVKKDIEQLERKLADLGGPPPVEAGPSGDDAPAGDLAGGDLAGGDLGGDAAASQGNGTG
jgi:hypothetical protein